MTKTLHTKQASGYTTDEGRKIAAHTLYTYRNENGEGPGVWYATEAHAARSFARWDTAENHRARARRRHENARLAKAAASFSDDPFARFDA